MTGCGDFIRYGDNMKCFLISPIGESGSEIRKRADKLRDALLRPVTDRMGLELIRIDEETHCDVITDRIFQHLDHDELVIADLTGKNPNVFYETGYRQKTGLPMIMIREKGEDIPFDVRAVQILEYSFDIVEGQDFQFVLEKAAEEKLSANIDSVCDTECTGRLPDEHNRVLQVLIKEYQRRIASGEGLTKARHFEDTLTVRTALFPEMQRDDLDTILRELAEEGYIKEEHADCMVMFFDLTKKAIS